MPQNVLDKVWTYFDRVRESGVDWFIQYRTDEDARFTALRELGVVAFAPLVYPHKPGMAQWLNEWAADSAARVPETVPTGTFHAEPGAEAYVRKALEAGARCFKPDVQVGGYDPRGFTGLGVFEGVLRKHPSLTAVIAHAGMSDYSGALELVERYRNVHVDTDAIRSWGLDAAAEQAVLHDNGARLLQLSR